MLYFLWYYTIYPLPSLLLHNSLDCLMLVGKLLNILYSTFLEQYTMYVLYILYTMYDDYVTSIGIYKIIKYII